MPSESILVEKKKVVEELTGKLKCQAGVFINYSGITVNEDTELRVKMREANVDYTVIKNTLMRFAIKNVGFDELDPILHGTTSLAVSDNDPIAPARIVKEYADKLPNYFEIKGGFMEGRVLSASEVNAIASIPPLPILRAQLLGTMLAPIASLAVVLKAAAEKGGATAETEVKTAEAPAPVEAAAEAPAPVEAAAEAPAPVEAAAEEPAPVEAAAEEPAPVEAAAEEPAPVEAAAEAPQKAPAKSRAKKPVTAEATTDEVPAEAPPKPPAKPRAKKPAADEKPSE